MAKKKEEIKEEVVEESKVAPIEGEFGNGDLNQIKDKINEIIKAIYPFING